MKQLLMGLSVFSVFIVLAGCATRSSNMPVQPEAGEGQGPSVLVESYKMGVGDMVQVIVWKNPELSVSEPVRPDGKIAVPLIGDVDAAGRGPEELAADIKQKLGSYLVNPNVTVILTGLTGHEFLSRIRVTGSVTRNISMTYHQGMTVLDAVLEAGSVNQYADANHTMLYRRTEGGNQTYNIRLENILENGDMTTNLLLMPGDVITVPERLF
jgi:polysaccharide export outer membrane protein